MGCDVRKDIRARREDKSERSALSWGGMKTGRNGSCNARQLKGGEQDKEKERWAKEGGGRGTKGEEIE